MEHLDAYRGTQARITEVVLDLDEADVARAVPSCPAWDVHDLVAHVAGIPIALTTGDFPTGDLQAWLDGLVAARRGTSVAVVLDEWEACGDAVGPVLADGGLLLVDLVIHEHDLRAAVGRPGSRDAAELVYTLPLLLQLLAPALEDAGLGAIAVEHDGATWRSHDAPAGWTMLVEPWEGTRVLGSRRTADEILAIPSSGDASAYLAVLDAHLPLPPVSLGE